MRIGLGGDFEVRFGYLDIQEFDIELQILVGFYQVFELERNRELELFL